MMKLVVMRKNHELLDENAFRKVIKVLLQYPDKDFSLSDLASEACIAKANIGPVLEKLHRDKYIVIEKLTNIWRIRANAASQDFIGLKIADNISRIYNSGIIDFVNSRFKNPRAVILFGSYRKGEDVTSSDADIAIEVDDSKEYRTVMLEEPVIEKIVGRKIQLHVFSRKHIDINVFNNIANGIVLSGFLEVRP